MVQKPKDLPVLEFFHVELRKLILGPHHLVGEHALRDLLEWPVTTGEDLSVELDVLNQCTEIACSLREFLLVILHDLLGLEHIFKHCFDFVDGVMATLNLQFVDHKFLSL